MKLNIDGAIIEAPHGIDVNVWDSTLYGDRPFKGIVISVYLMEVDGHGYNTTNTTNGPVLSIDTNLPQDEWGEDEWYGLTDETAAGDFPGEVLRFLAPFIEKEV